MIIEIAFLKESIGNLNNRIGKIINPGTVKIIIVINMLEFARNVESF
jgi:hypothetical protein